MENGNIKIQIDFNKNYQTIENVEALIRDSINDNILLKINTTVLSEINISFLKSKKEDIFIPVK